MAQVIVRKLDDRVVAALKRKAERHGHSLEQELRDILTGAATPRAAEKLALVDRIRTQTAPVPHPLAEDLIREDRDSR